MSSRSPDADSAGGPSVEELATANIGFLESVIQRLERLLAHKRSVAAAVAGSSTPVAVAASASSAAP